MSEHERVLVTSVEEAGEVVHEWDDGSLYVRLDSGDVIACGREVVVSAPSSSCGREDTGR